MVVCIHVDYSGPAKTGPELNDTLWCDLGCKPHTDAVLTLMLCWYCVLLCCCCIPQACNRMSYQCVPLYDTLGENAVEYIINHSEVRPW
jgi:hypothetical protein